MTNGSVSNLMSWNLWTVTLLSPNKPDVGKEGTVKFYLHKDNKGISNGQELLVPKQVAVTSFLAN